MAGSRIEKFGTIFSRLRGLLRSGAVHERDVPLWYSVYEAFPPAVEPEFERRRPRLKVPPILYPEDFVRVKFYQTFGNPDVVDLTKATVKTTCQTFTEKYFELQKDSKDPAQLFEEATKALHSQGIRLRALEEIRKAQAVETDDNKIPSQQQKFSLSDIYAIDENENKQL